MKLLSSKILLGLGDNNFLQNTLVLTVVTCNRITFLYLYICAKKVFTYDLHAYAQRH